AGVAHDIAAVDGYSAAGRGEVDVGIDDAAVDERQLVVGDADEAGARDHVVDVGEHGAAADRGDAIAGAAGRKRNRAAAAQGRHANIQEVEASAAADPYCARVGDVAIELQRIAAGAAQRDQRAGRNGDAAQDGAQ